MWSKLFGWRHGKRLEKLFVGKWVEFQKVVLDILCHMCLQPPGQSCSVGIQYAGVYRSSSDSHHNVVNIKRISLYLIKTDEISKEWVYEIGSDTEHCHMPVSLGEKVEATQKQWSLRQGENQEGVASWKKYFKKDGSSVTNAVAKSSMMSRTSS